MRATIEPLQLLTTGQIARRYGLHRDTVWGWITEGVLAAGGARVRLAGRKIGGQWKVSEEALEAFVRACEGDVTPVAGRPPSEDARRARKAQEDWEARRRRAR